MANTLIQTCHDRPAMAKRNFIVDYEIVGSLVIEAQNAQQAAWKARSTIERANVDLANGSAYNEAEISEPIDMQERYKLKAPGRRVAA